jgi:hypothetical protein
MLLESEVVMKILSRNWYLTWVEPIVTSEVDPPIFHIIQDVRSNEILFMAAILLFLTVYRNSEVLHMEALLIY